MRHVIAMFCLILSSAAASAATYYVSPTGSDAKDGTLPNTAWRTVAKVNGFALVPGDNVLFQGAGVWYEMLQPSANGTILQPITFSTYGNGSAVLNGGNGASGYAGIVASKSDNRFRNFEIAAQGSRQNFRVCCWRSSQQL
jgi:hypothetical protein